MCEECYQSTCPSMCPNAEDDKPILECKLCMHGIFANEDYYNDGDSDYCEDCWNEYVGVEFKRTANVG